MTHTHTWVTNGCGGFCTGVERDHLCRETMSRDECNRRLQSHDQLVEALEEIEIRARMAQGRDAKIPPESEADMLRDIMRHLQGDARAALAAARGEGE